MKQKILITGANRGLGLAMTRILLREENEVFALVRNPDEMPGELAEKYPSELRVYQADVIDEQSVKDAVLAVSRDTGYLDILINNSAVLFPSDDVPIEKADLSVYGATFEVNSVGPLRMVKYALPLIRKGNRGLIANISSEAGSISAAWRKSEYAYCMSKAALNMAGRILQNYVKDDGLTVLSVHPGWFSSDMGTSKAPITPDEAAEKVVALLNNDFDPEGHGYYDLNGEKMDW